MAAQGRDSINMRGNACRIGMFIGVGKVILKNVAMLLGILGILIPFISFAIWFNNGVDQMLYR